jgi:hypothetical protein
MEPIHDLRRRLKRGPLLSREVHREYLLCESEGNARRLRPAVSEKIKAEIGRLARTVGPAVQMLVRRMRKRYPELSL